MKIDLVYLWVDGSDVKWKAKKNAALKEAGLPVPADDAVIAKMNHPDIIARKEVKHYKRNRLRIIDAVSAVRPQRPTR